MAVNLTPPDPKSLLPVAGVSLGVAAAGIKKPNRKDLLLMALDPGARVAGVFTRNRFCAAPVVVAKEHLLSVLDPRSVRPFDSLGTHDRSAIRALVVNTGNANAGTGADGLARSRQTCDETAKLLGCAPNQVLPFSTGVIMEPLPVERIVAGLPQCVAGLRQDHWFAAAEAIMTTDTVPKAASRQVGIGGTAVTVTGIAKGSGMIRPNMATMLGFVATDAAVSPALLQEMARHAADHSFNSITVDGDTSTNDAFILIATGRSSVPEIKDVGSDAHRLLRDAVTEVASVLAQAIVRDGEGATKFMAIRVAGGRDGEECRRVAYAIAHSPLVKTAFFASDPNLGRILAAIGYAGVEDMDVSRVRLYLGDVLVAEGGGRAASYQESDGRRVMQEAEITIRVELDRGQAEATVWTCDFSYDYVKINAEYRT